jgi:hypothetical protein
VLVRRGFVRWLVDEADRYVKGESHSGVLEWTEQKEKLRLKEGVEVWLYVSALPVCDLFLPPRSREKLLPSILPSCVSQSYNMFTLSLYLTAVLFSCSTSGPLPSGRRLADSRV